MGGLSSKPAARARQLANLRPGAAPPELGNKRALKHGAYSAVAVPTLEAKVLAVFEAIAADGERVLTASDAPLVRLAAEVMCRLDSMGAWLAANGWLDAKGKPRTGILDLERRLRAEAADHLDALGASPRSRAKLGLDVARGAVAAMDLAAHWADDDADAEDEAPVVDGDAREAGHR